MFYVSKQIFKININFLKFDQYSKNFSNFLKILKFPKSLG